MPQAIIMHSSDQPMEVATLELAGPGRGQIRLRVIASGVCHSDLHIYQAGAPGMQKPIVLGHEGAGEVIGVGEGVDELAVGDHVVLTPTPSCGACGYCLDGQPILCRATTAIRSTGALPDGTMPLSLGGEPVGQLAGLGCWSEEAVVDQRAAIKIDKEMPMAAAALLGCAVVTACGAVFNVADVQPGDTMTVVGCGGLGLTAVQAGRIAGAGRIIAVDINPNKLEMARSFGATDVVDSSQGDAVEQVRELTGGDGTKFAFDFVGLVETAQDALASARRGGTLVMTGLGNNDHTFNVNELIRSGRTIKGNTMGMGETSADFQRLVSLYQDGQLQLDPLVSQRLKLSEVQVALDAMEHGDVARSVFINE